MLRVLAQVTVAAVLCLSAAAGSAQEAIQHGGTPEEQAACTPDVFRLCLTHVPNEVRIVACLRRNMARLSPACRKVFS